MRNRFLGEAERWFLQAKLDLDDARFNLSGRRFNVACFLAQQSAEKAIKAFLYMKGAEEIWGHSVADLCEDAIEFDTSFGGLKEEVAPLDKYYIPTRYPNALPGGIPKDAFDEDDAKKAVTLSERVITFVKTKFDTTGY